MSSILNALKKLENEMAQQSSLLKEIDPKKTIRRKTIGTWLFYSLISALFTAAILIGGGWLILQQKPALMKLLSPSAEKKSEAPRPIAAKKQELPPQPVPVQTPPVKIPSFPAQPLPVKPAAPESEEEIIILPKKKVGRAPQPIQEEIVPAAPPITDDSAEIAKIEQEIEQAIQEEPKEDIKEEVKKEVKPPDTPRAPDKAGVAPEKQIQGLAIQALVWSVDPKRRMAVINSQIVHIGDMLNSFRIKDIGSDYVILQEGGQDWKMKFQIN